MRPILLVCAAAAIAVGLVYAIDDDATVAAPESAPAARTDVAAPESAPAARTDAAAPTPAARPARSRARRQGRTVKLIDSQFGRILGDGRGQAVYIFDKERSSRSRCYGDCATAWPPVLTKGRPRAADGARQGLLGTTRRRDGRRQVTYRGKPLYYYIADQPGRVLCHDVLEFGGLWLVIRANGSRVG